MATATGGASRSPAINFRILTLNCWGLFVPVVCKFRQQRIDAIGQKILTEDYDIVLLQEIWLDSDFERLRTQLVSVLPYSHYFHSGVVGSGICIFSKHLLYDTHQHQFSLNGYLHKIYHGDWFGAKLVGLVKITVGNYKINIYNIHLHAQYYRTSNPDEYKVHRVTQAFELSQYVKLTSHGADAVLLAGDFNFTPQQLGYQLIRSNANLDDAFLAQRDGSGEECAAGMTSDRPDNCFCQPSAESGGNRIDHIMFRSNAGCDIICEKCEVTMDKIPNTDINYSDHLGVAAVFTIRRNVTAVGRQRDLKAAEIALTDARDVISEGLLKTKSARVYYLCLSLFLLVIALFVQFSFPLDIKTLVTVALLFSFFMCLIGTTQEMNNLRAARNDINNALSHN